MENNRVLFLSLVSIILTSLIYLIYTDDFNVTVPDSWPLIAHCRRILSGDISKIWGTLLERRPFLILYYALNSLWISLFGLQGVYVNVFVHIVICSTLLFFYIRSRTGNLIGFCTSILFLLYPSLTNQSAAYMCNYYQALSFSLLALLFIEKSLVLSSLCLLMSLCTVESSSIILLIHPFLVQNDFYRYLRRTAGIFFLTMSLYAIWRFLLFPIYGGVDINVQSIGGPVRYALHLIRGFYVTFLISHTTLFEYLSHIALFHFILGIVASLAIYFILTRITDREYASVRLHWVDIFRQKYTEAIGISRKKGLLKSLPKVLRLILVFCAALFLSLGYIINPEFMTLHFSPDGILESETLIEISYFRNFLFAAGILSILLSTSWGFAKFHCWWERFQNRFLLEYETKIQDEDKQKIYLFYLFFTGLLFVFLGYVYSVFGAATPPANPLGETSRHHFVAVVGASLAFASLVALFLRIRFRRLVCVGFSLYVGLLVAYHFQLQHDVADMGRLQRRIWNQIVDQVPDLRGKVCLILVVADTADVRKGAYVNDWDHTPDIPMRRERPLAMMRAFKGITWAENTALGLFYGPAEGSQLLLLTPEEVKAFMVDQDGLLRSFQKNHRGVYVNEPYLPGQILLFEYDTKQVTRRMTYAYEVQGKSIRFEQLGSDVIGSELGGHKTIQRQMRKLLLRREANGI